MHILIAGAGGYIGTEYVSFLLENGYKVTALDRFFFGDTLSDLKKNKNLRIVKEDIRHVPKKIFDGVDVFINLASISNDPAAELNPEITKKINLEGAIHIASLAKEMKVKKHIFASSCSIYGAGNGVVTETSPAFPISEYAKSKESAEEGILQLADNKFTVTVMRTATVYGLSKRRMRFDLMINIMTLHAWKNGKIYVRGNGEQWRPLIHITDCIQGFHLATQEQDKNKINKQIFNLGSNDQNYQVFRVTHKFKKHFPQLLIEMISDDPDNRSYHVNFDKITKILGLKTNKTIDDAIIEIKDSLSKGEVSDVGTQTHTLRHYQYLMEADKILSSVKLRNKLF